MVTVTSGDPYTWDTAAFSWDSTEGGKTWLTAAAARYTLAPAEAVIVLLTDRRAPHIPISENACLTELTARQPSHICDADLRTSDNYSNIGRLMRTASEHLSVTAAAERRPSHIAKSAVTLADKTARHTASHHSTDLGIDETLTERADYRRTLRETSAFLARSARCPSLASRSALALNDTYLQPWQGILSNVTLFSGGLTDDDWESASASPSGYSAFHPFEVGEYTYQDALIRILLTTGAAGADPLLYDVRFHVDIEDTRESGLAECSRDEVTRVALTRHYYHPPRIVLTVQSANTADGITIPHLVGQSIDEDGSRTFDCELLLADGTRTSGTISWIAEGY